MNHTKTTAKIFFTAVVFLLLSFSMTTFASAEGISVSSPSFQAVSATSQSVRLSWKTNDEVYCFKVYQLNSKTGKYEDIY